MERQEDPDQLADQLQHETGELQQRSEQLGDQISDVRDDWEAKRSDEGVPGAVPRTEDSDREQPGDQVNPEAPDGDE